MHRRRVPVGCRVAGPAVADKFTPPECLEHAARRAQGKLMNVDQRKPHVERAEAVGQKKPEGRKRPATGVEYVERPLGEAFERGLQGKPHPTQELGGSRSGEIASPSGRTVSCGSRVSSGLPAIAAARSNEWMSRAASRRSAGASDRRRGSASRARAEPSAPPAPRAR